MKIETIREKLATDGAVEIKYAEMTGRFESSDRALSILRSRCYTAALPLEGKLRTSSDGTFLRAWMEPEPAPEPVKDPTPTIPLYYVVLGFLLHAKEQGKSEAEVAEEVIDLVRKATTERE